MLSQGQNNTREPRARRVNRTNVHVQEVSFMIQLLQMETGTLESSYCMKRLSHIQNI